MFPVRTNVRVDDDGVLLLRIPLGLELAGKEVQITIERALTDDGLQQRRDWRQRLAETYGACAGLGLERPDPGEFEVRDPIE